MLRSDNAREFSSAANILNLRTETSPPHRHESNARAEAFNRLVNGGIRTSLLQSGLEYVFWPLAAVHWTFNYARTPHKALGNETPFSRRFNKEHGHLLIPFGRGCYYVPPDRQHQPKWDPSGRRGIIVGYHSESHEHDGSILILDYEAVCDFISLPIEDRSVRSIPIIRTKSWKLTSELFPVANFRSKLEITRAALKGVPDAPSEKEAISSAPEPKSLGPDRAPDDWLTHRPLLRVRRSNRPPTILPELWDKMSKKRKEEASAAYKRDLALPDKVLPPDPSDQGGQGGSSSSSSSSIVPAVIANRSSNNHSVLIEFCCDSDSNLFSSATDAGMHAVRLSLDVVDLSTSDGLSFTLELIQSYHNRGIKVFLFAAIPCTPWSSWQHYNYSNGSPSFKRNLLRRRALSLKIINNWKAAAQLVHKLGGHNFFEWPRWCSGWPHVVDFFRSVGMNQSKPDGCMLGAKTVEGEFMLKPWDIWSSCESSVNYLNAKRCNKQHKHFPCAGNSTTQSGHYSRIMTDYIIQSIIDGESDLRNSSSSAAICPLDLSLTIGSDGIDSVKLPPNNISDQSIKELCSTLATFSKQIRGHTFNQNAHRRNDKRSKEPHREKEGCVFGKDYMPALVHKLLTKADPDYHSAGAKLALEAELNKLKGINTWDHDTPIPWL